MTPQTAAARVAALALLVVLGACSSPPEPTDRVATMDTDGAAPTTASSTDPAASRPRERLDMTAEEDQALNAIYEQCMTDHGSGRGNPDESKRAAAEAACLSKKPLPPWEYDVANPESADFVHALVQCLRDNGVEYVEEKPVEPGKERRTFSLGGPDGDSASISKGLQLISSCEREVANGGSR